ncbi:SID1 transmembrane family member 1-like [Euwallacea fornicatus]|uniref:SID1 transmembrane family member 1-like n=1 Tax=Euwallacea fornicatus TaxID=995702 RepID=UPI00338FE7A7
METGYSCLILLIVASSTGHELTIEKRTAVFEAVTDLELNATVEYILTYPDSKALNPYTVKAWSSNADKDFPILLVVRQARQVSSWTIPETVETSQKNKTLVFYNTSKTLCHDDLEDVINPVFDVEPLKISQTFIVAVSTSSPRTVNISIALTEEKDFFMGQDTNYTVKVSPSQSKFKFFSFNKNVSDTVVVVVESSDDVCLTVSVQDSRCPVMDSNKDIKYEGIYQTVNKKGAMTISKRRFPTGFFLVVVAKADDYDCSQESSVIPFIRYSMITENSIVSQVSFVIKNSISVYEYLLACVIILSAILAFGLVFTGITFVFNRYGAISKLKVKAIRIQDHIEPLTEDEVNEILLSKNLTVDTFAKYPKRIKQRAFNYLSHTASIALFYSIPVIQLVVTYQRVVNLTGNQDMCYYNFLCAHPAFGFSDFNHIYSNMGYFLIGLFFIIGVMDRQYKIRITKDKGIPVHYGLFYAMGLALTIEGVLSACYHICPSQSNYQFDTSFMYVMAVLIMVKLYQNRHPDINATAYATFSVVGIAIFIAMMGILDGSLVIWVIFLVGYFVLILILSLKIYYLNFAVDGMKQFYNCIQKSGFCKETFVPLKKSRFVLVVLANVANFSILGVGVYIYIYSVTDFGTFLLGLLLANTVLHISFYTVTKMIYSEKICIESLLFGVLGLCFWIASSIFFLDAATLWTVTPAESRQWNQGCIFMSFYDRHDVWHLLSAPALYFTFSYLMYLDDDLCDRPQNEIRVF